MNREDYELFPGSREQMTPLFKDEAEEEAFRERFRKDLEPKLKEIARKHALSERESMERKLD